MKLILLGAPGAGKGTQAEKIVEKLGIPAISTGNIIRAALKAGTEMGLKAKSYMDAGQLVPDDVVIGIIKDRLEEEDCKNGFILDGFPRTIAQAKELEKISQIDIVILVDVPNETIIERLSARRTCPNCGEIYSALDYKETTCKKCSATLIQRDDDKPETIKNRLEVYENNTAPLINFYGDMVFKVSSAGSPEETYRPVKTFLENLEVK